MNFTEPIFLSFFAVTWAVFLCLRSKEQRIGWLVLASTIFYAKAGPQFVLLLGFVSLVDFHLAQRIFASKRARDKRFYLTLSVASNLGVLTAFKYSGFLARSFNGVTRALGAGDWLPEVDPPLPLAISFFTFEALSYSIDVYRGKFEPTRRLRDFFAFISFFPHLVAGPIVRAGEFLPQIAKDPLDRIRYSGVFLILIGFAKKLLLADSLGAWAVDPVFASPASFGTFDLWIAVYCYAFQIFLDFSGYTDIAVGLARLFGVDLGLNFDAPYLATSFREFWSRWHISLSTWFRDYVYLPLGGNRVSRIKWIRNIAVVFLLSGLWHGAAWKFLVWGGLHGLFLVLDRFCTHLKAEHTHEWEVPDWFWQTLSTVVVFNGVCFAWIFFRAADLSAAFSFIRHMFHPNAELATEHLSDGILIVLCVALLAHRLVEPYRYAWSEKFWKLPAVVQSAFAFVLCLGVYELSLQNIGKMAFIYFQF